MNTRAIPIVLTALALKCLCAGPTSRAEDRSIPWLRGQAGPVLVVMRDPRYLPVRVPPPPEVYDKQALRVPFRIHYNPPSCEGSVTPWPAASAAALSFAMTIWSVLVDGSIPITIDACWRTDLDPGVLGSARSTRIYRSFPGAPVPNTFYSVALVNQIFRVDVNGETAEIATSLNANISWYFGVDGVTPVAQYDLVSVVLHEIAHGLGFSDTMSWDDGMNDAECAGVAGQGCWGIDGSPTAYDRFIENAIGQNLITAFTNPSVALGNQLTSGNLYFEGSNVRGANGGLRARLFAPTTFWPGSSIAHLDAATFDATWNALMTPSLGLGEANHHPGSVALAVLRDIGWESPALDNVYVDGSVAGPGSGSPSDPFKTVIMGVLAVLEGGSVYIAPGDYSEHLTLRRPMTLKRSGPGGSVTIGR